MIFTQIAFLGRIIPHSSCQVAFTLVCLCVPFCFLEGMRVYPKPSIILSQDASLQSQRAFFQIRSVIFTGSRGRIYLLGSHHSTYWLSLELQSPASGVRYTWVQIWSSLPNWMAQSTLLIYKMWVVQAPLPWWSHNRDSKSLDKMSGTRSPVVISHFPNSLHYWKWLSHMQARTAGQHPARENQRHVQHGPLALYELIV